jgi:tetratricopeptide (TPR) repeat protein
MNRASASAAGLILLGLSAVGFQYTPGLASDDLSTQYEAVEPEKKSAPLGDSTPPSPELTQDSQPGQTGLETPNTSQAELEPSVTQPVQGTSQASTGDLISTIVELREAIRRHPDVARARLDLGSALYQAGDLDNAIEAYQETIRLEPTLADARLKLATALMAKHEWVRAREELQAAITLQPDFALAHYNLGAVRYTLGDHAGAIEAYREVLRLRPNYADAHYNAGLILKLTNRDTDAAYEFLAAASAGLPKAQYFVGAAYASGLGVERNLPAAIEWWFRAAEEDVTQAKEALAQLRRAALLKGARSHEEGRAALNAFADFRKGLWRQFPDLTAQNAEESVGVSLLRLGRAKEALPMLIREAYALSDQAQSMLESLYAHGVEGQVEPYDGRILAYWKTTAEEGLPGPRLTLARVYSHGLGVPQDLRKATSLLRNVPGEHAKALMKEISAMQQNGQQATRNGKYEPGISP